MKAFLNIGFLAALAFACGCGGNVSKVKTATLPINRAVKLGDAFDVVMENARWSEFKTEKGASVVCVDGDLKTTDAAFMLIFPCNVMTSGIAGETLKSMTKEYPRKGCSYFSIIGKGIAQSLSADEGLASRHYESASLRAALADANARIGKLRSAMEERLVPFKVKIDAYTGLVSKYGSLEGRYGEIDKTLLQLPKEVSFEGVDADRDAAAAVVSVEKALQELSDAKDAPVSLVEASKAIEKEKANASEEKRRALERRQSELFDKVISAKTAAKKAAESLDAACRYATRLFANARVSALKAYVAANESSIRQIQELATKEREALSEKYQFYADDGASLFSLTENGISATPEAYACYDKEQVDKKIADANKRIASEWKRGCEETAGIPPHVQAQFIMSADGRSFQAGAVKYSRGNWVSIDDGPFVEKFYALLLK